MKFKHRKLIKQEDLNANGTLFGGRMLEWLDEECAIYVMCQTGIKTIVTASMSRIDFTAKAYLGDVVEFGTEVAKVGRTSITVKCIVRNKTTRENILVAEEVTFVCLDSNGKPTPHNFTLQQ